MALQHIWFGVSHINVRDVIPIKIFITWTGREYHARTAILLALQIDAKDCLG